ncbi:MAG TPA: aminopeptidase N [Burkholderiales bacterium]|nr:aminopeptidase N [Burkholderiales bacterium]
MNDPAPNLAINMLNPAPKTIHLKDYTPPAFLISTVDLDVDIRDEDTLVKASLAVSRNPLTAGPEASLELDGDELELLSVALDGRLLSHAEYTLDAERLTIAGVPDRFMLDTLVRIKPKHNSRLMGLFTSKDGYFSQCEAEGFRRITFFPDRPDVMACYTTTIHADRAECPWLLSNGNLVSQGDEDNLSPALSHATGEQVGNPQRNTRRHWAKWVDPFPKPAYLFAMVAARLDRLEDTFVTRSGRTVKLFVFVEPGKLDQCGFAMAALKRAMKWDEDVFGLELDLDQYMIVAVGDFNMGAMENKGLNIFNTKYVLARADTATDSDFMFLDRVVAHEYFHNWTGNRVTCRDWFQLSLKEGLTVFRDQEYGADTYSRPVQRIQEVRGLRGAQFPEDAGPMAHPVRPESYMEISNFYTATVYEKGAELVRMIHTLIGTVKFRKGMDLYFQRHDGQAVRTEEFVQAMQDASGLDLTQFKRWYSQAGTPMLDVRGRYDPTAGRYTLTVKQFCAPTPGQKEKLPFHMPLTLGLVGPDGNDLPLQLDGEKRASGTTRVLQLKRTEEEFVFVNVGKLPVPSLLRGFSAPVNLRFEYSDADLAHLMAHDADAFNRWEAGQRLALNLMLKGIASRREGRPPVFPESFVEAFSRVLADAAKDPAFAAEALGLPSEGYLAEQMEEVDAEAIHAVRIGLRKQLAASLKGELLATYQAFAAPGPYNPDAISAGQRSLRNLCLSYLMELEDAEVRMLCVTQFEDADNMTDSMAALTALANADCPERKDALEKFYAKWQDEPLVMDKWFAVQATSRLPDTLAAVKRLMSHSAFDLKNPNKVRAVIGSFCQGNHVRFHAADGSGYAFAADQVIALDPLNPQVSARLARCFDRWRKFDAVHRQHARAALERIRDTSGLSKDTTEVVTRALA